MTINKSMTGRGAIDLLRGLFDIKQEGITNISIDAPFNSVATVTISGILRRNRGSEALTDLSGDYEKYKDKYTLELKKDEE